MAKAKSAYVCSNCGFEASKWNGKCPECGEWNTFEEVEIQVSARTAGKSSVSTSSTSTGSNLFCFSCLLISGFKVLPPLNAFPIGYSSAIARSLKIPVGFTNRNTIRMI